MDTSASSPLNPETVRRLRGAVFQPSDEQYDAVRRVWNGMIDNHPQAIVRCRGVADVMAAVEAARRQDLSIAVRGGGHNVAGSAVAEGALVVDLSEMRSVRVDREQQTVRAEGGALLGDVDRETQAFGRAAPLGVVSKTGIAGLTLNGGVGHLRRQYGLSCDNLVSADVVTADGRLLTASDKRNEDLFWALRGGGGNFGVVTSLEYRLHEVGPEISVLFVWHYGDVAAEALRQFRDYAPSASREASVLPFFGFVPEMEEFPEANWGEPAIIFLGCHAGRPAQAEEDFRPLRSLAEPLADLSGRMTYTDLQSLLDPDYPDGRRYYWKAVYLDELTDDVVELIARHGAASPSPLSTVDLWHLGGAISDLAQRDTAFWHRDKAYMLTFEANWDDLQGDEANIAWVRDGVAAARELPGTSGGYGNFPGLQEDPARTIFGGNYDRLVEVKRRFDPENLFRHNTNVRPDG